MPISIQILKQSTLEVPEISSYKLVVQTVNAEGMTDKIFVNQRIHNFAKGKFEDTFVAIATPVQLEDFAEDAPEEGTSYYRTNKIELVARTPEMIQTVMDSLLYEVKKLVIDLTDMENLSNAEVFNISAIDSVREVLPAPVITSITGGQNQLTVNFTDPNTQPAIRITNYQYSVNGGTTWFDRYPAATTSPFVISDLADATTYNVQLRSNNAANIYGVPTVSVYGTTLPPI